MNKKSDNFIEEQKKYINYYKTKKSYGKKEAEFQEYVNKKGNELSKIDKIDISLLTNEISELTGRLEVSNRLESNIRLTGTLFLRAAAIQVTEHQQIRSCH